MGGWVPLTLVPVNVFSMFCQGEFMTVIPVSVDYSTCGALFESCVDPALQVFPLCSFLRLDSGDCLSCINNGRNKTHDPP
jgi:hypothetical protein